MSHKRHSRERGQSLVLVALMVVAFIAMLALVLDGGTAYAARRTAQNAADAGALAGAQILCLYGDTTAAANAASDYTITRNGADRADVSAVLATHAVSVTAYVRRDSFFAGLIGTSVYTTTAVATASCSPAGGMGVMPIAWACRAPITGVTDPERDCAMYIGEFHKYLIMDSKNVNEDFYCQDPPNSGNPPNTLDCDLDNDQVDEFLGGGDRSWMDLDGGGADANEMKAWINGSDPTPELFPHTWYADRTGVGNSIFDETKVLVGSDVLIPIFNKYCKGDPRDLANNCGWDTGVDDIVEGGGASTLYYHIIGFALFHVSCVDASPKPVNENPLESTCPVHEEAVKQKVIKDNVKSIEGYFVEGLVTGHGTGDWAYPDTGAYVVRLVR